MTPAAHPATQAGDDWTVVEARKLAVVCRKHGLRCRVVRSKHHDSQLHIYRDGEHFEERLQAARAEAREKAIDASWAVVAATLSKRDVRMKAREYAAASLLTQDEPDWAEEAGVPRELMAVFMDELVRIAHRIERTIQPVEDTRSRK